MKLSIVLAGDRASDLFAGLQRLVPVVDGLEAAGVTVETVVAAYDHAPDVDALAAAVEGAAFVRPRKQDGTILERWRPAVARTAGDVLWLLGPDSEYDEERFADHLAVLDSTVQIAYDDGQALIRRGAVGLLDLDPENTPVLDFSARDSVGAIVAHARRRRVRAVEVPLALPPRPFRGYEGLPVTSRIWHGATVYEAAPGVVRAGPHSRADTGTVIRTWNPSQHVIIGNFTYLAAGVLLSNPSEGVGPADRLGPQGLRPTGGHNVNLASIAPMHYHVAAIEHRYASQLRPSPLVVGNDVWIGSRAVVVGDLTIGDGAIICAGAVVLGDVPPYAVVEGNPGKVVRMRFSPGIVESLLRINWWDWDDETIAARADWFTRPIAEFCNRFDPVRRSAMLGAPSTAAVFQPV